ncbi:MAG: hypothetical protein H6710_12620 [Myxococcales bacterium]|nr:hypothetical protein [Myxococcales bacterium]
MPCPTLGDLLERAGRELGRALTTAGRLAARRIALQDQALALREAIIAAPWEEWSPPWPIPPRALTPGDLARALLAELPDVVEGLLFAGEARRSEYTDQRWREDVERWRAAAAEPGPALDPALPLVRPWARRWALILADRSAQPLATIQALAEPVRAAMIGYVGFYGDRMGVAGEAREALRRAVGAAAEREGVAYDRIGPGLGTPYYDRHGGVAALEAALARGPGAILVGEVGSGRRSLLEAVAGRVRRREGPPELAGFVSAVDRCDQPPAFVDGGLVLPINRVERHVLGLVGLGVGPALGPASDPAQGPWLAALGELLARSGDGDRLRLVLGITPGSAGASARSCRRRASSRRSRCRRSAPAIGWRSRCARSSPSRRPPRGRSTSRGSSGGSPGARPATAILSGSTTSPSPRPGTSAGSSLVAWPRAAARRPRRPDPRAPRAQRRGPHGPPRARGPPPRRLRRERAMSSPTWPFVQVSSASGASRCSRRRSRSSCRTRRCTPAGSRRRSR